MASPSGGKSCWVAAVFLNCFVNARRCSNHRQPLYAHWSTLGSLAKLKKIHTSPKSLDRAHTKTIFGGKPIIDTIDVDFISFPIFYFLSKMALDPPTHFQIVWIFFIFATSLNKSFYYSQELRVIVIYYIS